MSHMQTGLVLTGQLHCQTRTLITGLSTAYLGMMSDIGILAVPLLSLSHPAVDDGGILAMGHDGHGGLGKDAVEGFTPVDKHIAR